MNNAERAYRLAKAYRDILRERGVEKSWHEVIPTQADIDEARRRITVYDGGLN